MLPTFSDVQAAADLLRGVAHRTPVVTSRTFDALTGATVFFKPENLQRVGAFKFRGAYNALACLSGDEKRRGALAYSSGNHAQGMALAGQLLGVPVVVVMPADAPAVKVAATRGYGAEVVLYDRATQVRETVGREIAEARGLALVPPYDHADVIAGQGTAALELFEDVASLHPSGHHGGALDALVVCVGGGGLLSGCGLVARALAPGCRVIGVEPEAGDDAKRSFESGTLCTVHEPVTIADGARTPSLGRLTFPLVQQVTDAIVTVPDAALLHAMRFFAERMKLVVEPTGCLAAAAVMTGAAGDLHGQRVGVVLSGGNADLRLLCA